MILPCLFTFGSLYGNKVLFGLLDSAGLHPVKVVSSDKVRPLHAKPEPVPPELDLLLIGHECEDFLSAQGLMGPLLHAMAEDMDAAIRTQTSKRAQGTDKRYQKQRDEHFRMAYLMGVVK